MLTKRMIGTIYVMLIVIVVFFATACSAAKDEPMPLTQNNIEKFYKKLESVAKNIDPASGTEMERIVKVYKPAMDKMGYSLDKTIRYMMLNINQIGGNRTTNQFVQIIWPAYTAAVNTPEEALKNGLITQRTSDLITMGKNAGESISDEVYQYIRAAIECQQENNNVVLMPKFLALLARKGLLPSEFSKGNVSFMDTRMLSGPLMDKGRFQGWGTRKWILSPDGSKIDHGIAPEDANLTFIVNIQKVDTIRKYSQLVEEERRSMMKKQ